MKTVCAVSAAVQRTSSPGIVWLSNSPIFPNGDSYHGYGCLSASDLRHTAPGDMTTPEAVQPGILSLAASPVVEIASKPIIAKRALGRTSSGVKTQRVHALAVTVVVPVRRIRRTFPVGLS